MYIKLDSDMNLSVTVNEPIYRGDNLNRKIIYLIPAVIGRRHLPALSGITVVDTTGAGDIFGGSAMWKLLSLGKSPETLNADELRQVVRFACTSAGLSTTRPGGISSVPAYSEVIRRLEEE